MDGWMDGWMEEGVGGRTYLYPSTVASCGCREKLSTISSSTSNTSDCVNGWVGGERVSTYMGER